MKITLEIPSLQLIEQAQKALENIKKYRKEKLQKIRENYVKTHNTNRFNVFFKIFTTLDDTKDIISDHYCDDYWSDTEDICNAIIFNNKHNSQNSNYTISVNSHNQILKFL